MFSDKMFLNISVINGKELELQRYFPYYTLYLLLELYQIILIHLSLSSPNYLSITQNQIL